MQGTYYTRAVSLAYCQPTVAGLLFFHVSDEADLGPEMTVELIDTLRTELARRAVRTTDQALEVWRPESDNGDPGLREIGQDENIRMNGVAGKSVDLIGTSPLRDQAGLQSVTVNVTVDDILGDGE